MKHSVGVRDRQQKYTGERCAPSQFAQKQWNGKENLAVSCKVSDGGETGSREIGIVQQGGGVHAQQQ